MATSSESSMGENLAALSESSQVPDIVRHAASWAWRILLIIAALYVMVLVIEEFAEVFVPLALALLGSAFLLPAVNLLERRGIPRAVAVVGLLVSSIALVSLLLTFVVRQFIDGFPDLVDQTETTVNSLRDWLQTGPIHLKSNVFDNLGDNFIEFMKKHQTEITSGAIATATTVTQLLTALFLTIFVMIFFLYEGGKIWKFLTRLVTPSARKKVEAAGIDGFGSLVGYVRATVLVAGVDAVGIGVGLLCFQVPLALPLATLVFIGAFVPIVGALITGGLAVLIALVTKGWFVAVIILAIVIAVMQIESHVLQPFLLGKSVKLHPLAVVLAIAAGIIAAGIIGGLLAVPLLAFLNTVVRSLLTQSSEKTRSELPSD